MHKGQLRGLLSRGERREPGEGQWSYGAAIMGRRALSWQTFARVCALDDYLRELCGLANCADCTLQTRVLELTIHIYRTRPIDTQSVDFDNSSALFSLSRARCKLARARYKRVLWPSCINLLAACGACSFTPLETFFPRFSAAFSL